MKKINLSFLKLLIFPILSGCVGTVDGGALPCLSRTASIVALSDAQLSVEGDVQIAGGLVLLGRSTLQLQRGLELEGVVVASSQDQLFGAARETVRRRLEVDVTPRESRVLQWAQAMAQLTPDEVYDSLESQHAFVGTGGLRVIQVTGDIAIAGNTSLRFVGGPQDVFVVQVGGNLSLAGTSAIQTAGGLPANHILFVMSRDEATIQLAANASVEGTLFAPRGTAQLTGQSRLRGAVFAWDSIRVSGSGVSVVPAPFCPASKDSQSESAAPLLSL